jgi:transcriptional regulator with XRE-family HTH domain
MTEQKVNGKQVDPGTAEAVIIEKKIGERIKRLRLKKSMGLVELGRHTGLSASFLSQLETGRVVPTLRNLARIAMVFSKDLAYFFEPEPHSLFRVHRKDDRVRLPQSGVEEPTYFFENLGYMVPDRSVDPYLAEFVPLKKSTDVRSHVHTGYEFLYLLEGSLEIRHADAIHTLDAGDAVYFDASTPHSYRCAGKTKSSALIVTVQPPTHQSLLNPKNLAAARIPGLASAQAPAAQPPALTAGALRPAPASPAATPARRIPTREM